MDVKNHNKDRMMNLHGIISDQVHKVEYIEEYISSLFIAIVNPEDEKVFTDVKSFQDRIVTIRMPYVLDFKTEVEIYRHMIGRDLNGKLLPRVLENFAKVIISSRMSPTSEGMKQWISNQGKYQKYCDKNLLLLKMDIYTGYIPSWVSEEDRKNFDAKKRRIIISEAEHEGEHGISGRQSIQLFINYFNQFTQSNTLLTMDNLLTFFNQQPKSTQNKIPTGFLDALKNLYDFDILQEVKEALYDYNRKQVGNDVKNYLAAISYDEGSTITSAYTDDVLEINESFFNTIEKRILGEKSSDKERHAFREHIQKEYISTTLARELMAEKRKIEDTNLFKSLHASYSNRLKEHVLDPLINNENFRMAIKAFNTREFGTYNTRIRQDVELLFANLQNKFFYTEIGAQQVCIYVLDNKLAEKFAETE
ncbi:hypothetical protein BVX99_03380 [bacterium F16]|nr:hypothetical protein BVX99_03380 [bacterium F16]